MVNHIGEVFASGVVGIHWKRRSCYRWRALLAASARLQPSLATWGAICGEAGAALMRQVLQRMQMRGVTASIDLHNNTGRNPHYSCICSLASEHLQLRAQFGSRVMFFTRPLGVQTAVLCITLSIDYMRVWANWRCEWCSSCRRFLLRD